MFLPSFEMDPKLSVAEIVARDYRTADVFRRYGIGYCCGGKWPLDMACEMQGVDPGEVQAGLANATRTIQVSSQLNFAEWDIDFLIHYIINIHHQYLVMNLPVVNALVRDFAREHARKFPWLGELQEKNDLLSAQLLLSMKKEEEILFPYIKQVAHAHKDRESYAALLIRTLRKPIDEAIINDHLKITDLLLSIRAIANQYAIPPNVCTSHKVVLSKLKELDNDITQHLYLEQSILYPRALEMEKEALAMR